MPIVESSGSGEVIRQIKQVEKALSSLDMDALAAESTTTVEQKIGKREGCSAESSKEARVAVTLAQTVKEQEDQEAHKAATEATGARPLDRCSDIVDNTISALHKAGAPAEHLEQARQAAHTLINGLHSCGSGGGCRRARRPDDGLRWLGRGIPADADESIARRRNRQVGTSTIDLQTLTNRERNPNSHKHWRSPARTTHNAMRVAHTERLILATVNVKSLKPKELSRSHKYGVDTNSTIDQIDRDMSLHRCHVVGVQESCINGNVTREQLNFVAYTSGANGRGQLGVDAWVHRSVLMRARVRNGTLLSPFAGPQD